VQAQHAERERAAVDEPGRLPEADQHPTEHHIREHRKGGAGERLTLVSASVCAASIERYLGKGRPEALSQAAPEVMAIVAYEQPVTRADIRATRQVDSDAAVETLMARKLIAEDPRFGGRGRPSFLVTTELFLWSSPLSSAGQLHCADSDLARWPTCRRGRIPTAQLWTRPGRLSFRLRCADSDNQATGRTNSDGH
jgi:putative transcriptional regulator (Ypuh-like)